MNKEPNAQADDAILLDDDLWEELIALTDGAAAKCYQCGVCSAICPWAAVRGENLSVRMLIRQVQLGMESANELLWLCTTCAQCEAYCPRGVAVPEVLRALRLLAWRRRRVPAGLPTLLWSLYWNNNPWQQPPSQRARWAEKLALPLFDPQQHEVLFYVGSTAAYNNRVQKVAQALVKLLRAAGVTFGILGVDEPASGANVLDVGQRPYFEEVAQHAAHVFRQRGVARVLTISPHAYDVFKNHYPRVSDTFEALHYTQFLAELLAEGRLRFEKPLNLRVTFHDPCFLARHNAETEAPRALLSAIPAVELLEMENAKVDTLCCGGGGGRIWLETASGERFSDSRVAEAQACDAQILVTACPFCLMCLEDSLKAQKVAGLVLMDVAEIAALAL